MTTTPVASITDDQLAELEEICRQQAFECCGNFSVGGEYMGAQERVCCMEPSSTERDISWPAEEILELVVRLRAAEKDAARYRWLRERVGVDFAYGDFMVFLPTGGYVIGEHDKENTDSAIDVALEQKP